MYEFHQLFISMCVGIYILYFKTIHLSQSGIFVRTPTLIFSKVRKRYRKKLKSN